MQWAFYGSEDHIHIPQIPISANMVMPSWMLNCNRTISVYSLLRILLNRYELLKLGKIFQPSMDQQRNGNECIKTHKAFNIQWNTIE